MKRIFTSLAILGFIGLIALGVILYSRGYRFNFQEKSLSPTGILSASSYPEQATIWVNDKLLGTTNASLSLAPDWYKIRISKEGYQPWEKNIKVQGEIVSQIDALLIPTNPSLGTLTVNGVLGPVLSPTNTKIAFVVPWDDHETLPLNQKSGIWIIELRTGPFGGKSEPRQIYQFKNDIDPASVKVHWSADEKNLLVLFLSDDTKAETVSSSILLGTERVGDESIVGTSTYQSILDAWDEEFEQKENLTLATFPPEITSLLASTSGRLRFSPDETKLLFTATSSASLPHVLPQPLIGSNPSVEEREIAPDTIYVYDKKEDKNFRIASLKEVFTIDTLQWYSDSKHIVMVENDIISIIDYDGTNKRGVYGGPFEKSIIFTWPSGPKLIILTNLNNPKGTPNLYLIDLT